MTWTSVVAAARRRPLRALYLTALVVFWIWRLFNPSQNHPAPDEQSVVVAHGFGDADAGIPVRIAYRSAQPEEPDAPVILLLHGSPVGGVSFRGMLREASGRYRMLAPDMAGFGGSTRWIPDYSFSAQAGLMWQLLDSLGVEQVHVVGYSYGGGVGAVMAALEPGRVRSLQFVSSIGVQELELLGDYHVNHVLHGAAALGVWLLHYGVPHFGTLDAFPLNMGFGRSFLDSDQRPIRGIMSDLQMPVQIIQGESDILVAPAAAYEHHRIIPQSELVLHPGGHELVFARPGLITRDVEQFVARVEVGEAPRREDAAPERVREALVPFSASSFPRASGALFVLIVGLIVIGTLISEDLTCIAAGLLAARGTLGVMPAVWASFAGILVGDVLLYGVGRWMGEGLLTRPPLGWLIRRQDVVRSREWLTRNGFVAILSSRFIPGARLPTYFGAGLLRTGFVPFLAYCTVAGVIWAPLLVGVAYIVGDTALQYYAMYSENAVFVLLAIVVALYVATRVGVAMASVKGRRLLLSRYRRLTRWEFWPVWVVYPPVLLYILYLGLRHRSLTLFTSANPAMPMAGLVGESKSAILAGLERAGAPIARFRTLSPDGTVEDRAREVADAMSAWGCDDPVVLKPDVGERGAGVAIVRGQGQVRSYLQRHVEPVLVQEYVDGREYGVFYYRLPGEDRGRILSITDKRPVHVTGDGSKSLERLILDDDRAVCMASLHLARHAPRLAWVPDEGERVALTDLGTHCRGAVFLNGSRYHTEALEAAVDEFSRRYDGFFFGRYDVRVPPEGDLAAGKGLRVIELNGVTSEATHIYEPGASLLEAYRVLFRQWRIAFEIGRRNRELGHAPATLGQIIGRLLEHYHRDTPRDR